MADDSVVSGERSESAVSIESVVSIERSESAVSIERSESVVRSERSEMGDGFHVGDDVGNDVKSNISESGGPTIDVIAFGEDIGVTPNSTTPAHQDVAIDDWEVIQRDCEYTLGISDELDTYIGGITPDWDWGPFLFIEGDENHPRIHYRLTGNDDAPLKLVFIHGLMSSLNSWDYQIPYFSQLTYIQSLFFDNRGVGFSDSPPGPYTTQQMATDTLRLIQHLGWKNVSLVGISLGGMIAQQVALLSSTHNIHISHLLLISTRLNQGWWYGLPAFSVLYNALCRSLFTYSDDYRQQAEYQLPNIFSQEFLKRKGVKEKMIERHIQKRSHQVDHPDTFRNQLAAANSHNLTTAECNRLKNDENLYISAISGNGDLMIHYSNTVAMEEMLGARVQIVLDCGHCLTVEAAQYVNQWIEKEITKKKGSEDVF
jgi:pimeloyl-ACP methyl ester carboxylesterase